MTKEEIKSLMMEHSEQIAEGLAETLAPMLAGEKELNGLTNEKKVESKSVTELTTDLLRSFGMSRNLNGFSYIVLAMEILLRNGRPQKIPMGKKLYPEIASEFGINAGQVERSIRSAIDVILTSDNAEKVANALGYEDVSSVSKAGAFLMATAEKIYEKSIH